MNSMRIDIMDSKASKFLRDLADMNLITIKDLSKNGFAGVLKRLHSKAKDAPSLEEIAKKMEAIGNNAKKRN